MNRWKLTDEIKEDFMSLVKDHIVKIEGADLGEVNLYDITLDLSGTEMNPSRLEDLLEILGYKKEDMDENGWQWDFWIKFTKKHCRNLVVRGCGYTFELKLSGEDY